MGASAAGTTASCSFSNLTFDPVTNSLVANCTSIPPASCTSPSSGTFSFPSASSGPYYSGQTAPVSISRTGGSDCGYVLGYSVSAPASANATVNGSAVPTGTVTFLDKEATSKVLGVSARTSVPADVTLTLSGSAPGGITPFASHTVRFNPFPIPEGCPATTPQAIGAFTTSNEKIVLTLKPGDTGTVTFTPSASSGVITLSTTDTTATPAEADHEVAISRCPNDFTAGLGTFCHYSANFVGNSRQANTGLNAPLTVFQCPVQAGTTYYMNVRQVKNGTTIPSCPNASCEVRLQNTGL